MFLLFCLKIFTAPNPPCPSVRTKLMWDNGPCLESQRTQRVMLSDTNCSFILSGGGVFADLQSTPLWGLWWRKGEEGREAETRNWLMKFWRFSSCCFFCDYHYAQIIKRISCPPLTNHSYCLWGCSGLFTIRTSAEERICVLPVD